MFGLELKLHHVAMLVPGTILGVGGAFAAGTYLGYSAGQGAPIPNDALYLMGGPLAAGGVSMISPLSFQYPEMARPLFLGGAFLGGALETVGYLGGYLTGRLTS